MQWLLFLHVFTTAVGEAVQHMGGSWQRRDAASVAHVL